jgi:predicted alternative tryptophan synthase beta-subunit
LAIWSRSEFPSANAPPATSTHALSQIPSPSTETKAGRKIREQFPNTTGSLGIAISEAIEVAAKNPGTNYTLGSVLNHVCMHQTVMGLKALAQFDMANGCPNIIIACAGGGLRYHGMAPLVSHAQALGLTEARSYHQKTCFEAAVQFARTRGLSPRLSLRMRFAAR